MFIAPSKPAAVMPKLSLSARATLPRLSMLERVAVAIFAISGA